MLCLQERRTCCVSLCPMRFSNFAVSYLGGVSSPMVIASSLLSCLFIVAVFFPAALAGMAGGCSMLSWKLRFVRIIKYLRYVVVPLPLLTCRRTTPSCQLRLKARVDLGDQTAEFIPFEVISTAILTYFYLLLGTNVRILVSAINTHFQPDAPGWCSMVLCTPGARFSTMALNPCDTSSCPKFPTEYERFARSGKIKMPVLTP